MPGVAGKSGRKAKTVLTRQANQIIMDTAPHAAQYLGKVVRGEVKRPSLARIEVCKFVINHAIGSPRQKVELSGKVQMPYSELAKSAEEALKEAEEEAQAVQEAEKVKRNYQRKKKRGR